MTFKVSVNARKLTYPRQAPKKPVKEKQTETGPSQARAGGISTAVDLDGSV